MELCIPFSVLTLALGFCLDALLGDPYWMPHPVRFIGWLIQKTEAVLRRFCGNTSRSLRLGGLWTVLLVLTISTAVPALLLWAAGEISYWVKLALETIMCYQILAAKALRMESTRVYKVLEKGNLAASRKAVSMIVGRDTAELTADQVAKAAVETVAENTSDGVIAPMLFLILGGPALGFFYKAVNTMDSMLGYKNEAYIDFGRYAAKLDDFINFIPARISALLMIVSARILRMDAKNAWRIFRRDRLKHTSPNSAQTESVCAGALGVQLAGDASYSGRIYEKPAIGDTLRPIEPRDILRANRLMYLSAVLALMLCATVRTAVFWLLGT